MKMNKNYKRKKLLIDPSFQLGMIGFFCALSMVGLCLFYIAQLYFFWKWQEIGLESGLSPQHVFFRFLFEQRRVMNWIFLIASCVSFFMTLFCGLYLSHRIAGPASRMSQHLLRCVSSQNYEPIELRKKDFLYPLATAWNRVVDKFNS